MPIANVTQAAPSESEVKLRLLLDNMAEGLMLFDVVRGSRGEIVDLIYREANKAMEFQAGFDRAKIIGQRFKDIVTPADAERWISIFAPTIDRGEPVTHEDYSDTLDRWFSVSAHRYGDDQLAVFYRDISERTRAEAARRASEEKYRTLFEKMQEGFSLLERVVGEPVDYRYLAANPAFERHTGLSNPVGKTIRETTPGVEDAALESYRSVEETGLSQIVVTYVPDVDRWFEVEASSVEQPGQIAVLFRDITERKRAEIARRESEEHQAFLLRLSDALRAEPSAEAVADRALQMLFEQMGLDRCYIGIYRLADDRADFPQQVHDDSLSPVPPQVRLSDFPEALLISFDRTLVVDDAVEMENFSDSDRASFSGLGLRAVIAATLRKGENNPLWAIVVGSASARAWTRSEVSLVEEVTERTWAAVERARAETAIRASEEKYRSLFETMGQGYSLVENVRDENGKAVDQRYLELNPAVERLLGAKAQDAVGRLGSEVFPGIEEVWTETFDRVTRTGVPEHIEDYNSGADRWFGVYVYPAGGDRFMTLYEDVTDRKRAELALRESEERQAFLLKLSDALRPLAEPSAIQIEAMCVLGKHLAVNRAQYHEMEPNNEWIRPGGGYANGVPLHPARSRMDDFGAFVRDAYEAGETLIVTDTESDARISDAHREAWVGIGVRAFVAVPLVKNGRLVSVLGLDHATPRSWSQAEIALVEEVAERTWAAVERARAEQRLRESEERFAQFAASSTDVLWIRRAQTMEMEYLSPAFASVYGTDPEAAMDGVQHWAALVVPDDREVALSHLDTARRGEAAVHEFRIRRPADGSFRWIRDHVFPLTDDSGVKWIGGIATDITKAKLLAEHQSVLLAELQHRVRNIMAMLRSLVARTAPTAADIADYERLITGRLMAMARTQTLLTRGTNRAVELGTLIRQELGALADHAGQFEYSGPEVMVSPKAAEVLALAVHELATNALKYGALSTAGGRIEVSVQVVGPEGAPRARLDWAEQRPAPSDWTPPKRTGFGTQLITQRVPYELRGRGEIVMKPQGAHAVIEFPLQQGASAFETDAPAPSSVHGGSIDMTGEASLAGQTVLVLEDDFYLAQDASTALGEAGARVAGPYGRTDDAVNAIKDGRITAAVLDINLGAGPSFEAAYAMREAGVPFLFLTGYDHAVIPATFADVMRLQKPVEPREIIRAVAALAEA